MIGNLWAIFRVFACLVVTAILLPPYLLTRRLNKPVYKAIAMRWHRCICRIFGIKVEMRGQLATANGHGVLIAANHVSWLDILVLASIAPVSFVAKEEVKGWPIFGALAKWQDSVFVDRNIRASAGQQAAEINRRLEAGDNIVLFPEGTTSDGNFILPFKSTLFGAIGVGGNVLESPIQPVSIAYVKQFGLPMGRFERQVAAWPGDVEMGPHLLRILREGSIGVIVSFGSTIDIDEHTNRKKISMQVCQQVSTMTSFALRGREPLLIEPKTH